VVDCVEDKTCLRSGIYGRCIFPEGRCAFEAADCKSGWRWDPTAGEPIAGQCVTVRPDGSAPADVAASGDGARDGAAPVDGGVGEGAVHQDAFWERPAADHLRRDQGGSDADNGDGQPVDQRSLDRPAADHPVVDRQPAPDLTIDRPPPDLKPPPDRAPPVDACVSSCAEGAKECTDETHARSCREVAAGCWQWAAALPCGAGQTCWPKTGTCGAACGDGRCQAARGEQCVSCAEDCGCPAGQSCWTSKQVCAEPYCDGVDNDNNGKVDDGCPCADGWAVEWEEPSAIMVGVWAPQVGGKVFAVGSGGTILQYDGRNWSSMASGTKEDLADLAGSSDRDIFAVGSNSTILHFDGSSWSKETAPVAGRRIASVWVSRYGDRAFAVGELGVVLKRESGVWSDDSPGLTDSPLAGVWSDDGGRVFAVGHSGTVLCYQWSSWSLMEPPGPEKLLALWGTSWTDVLAVGGGDALPAAVFQFDGSDWMKVASTGRGTLTGVWGTSANSVYTIGIVREGTQGGSFVYRYDAQGGQLTPIFSSSDQALRKLRGTSANNVFAVGNGPTFAGIIVHRCGSGW
jgi:hypothetical protein